MKFKNYGVYQRMMSAMMQSKAGKGEGVLAKNYNSKWDDPKRTNEGVIFE